MGGSESKSSVKQSAYADVFNSSFISNLNQTMNETIINAVVETVKQCSSQLMQTQRIVISGIRSYGDINIDTNQNQSSYLSFACAQNDEVHNQVTSDLINSIMQNFQTNIDAQTMANLSATAEAKATDEWLSFPWGGAETDSSVKQDTRINITQITNKDLKNVVSNAVQTNFTNNNFANCIARVIANQEFIATNLATGGTVYLTVNQDQSAKVLLECIQSSKITSFISQNIANFFEVEVDEDLSSDTGIKATGNAISESLKGGPLEGVGRMFEGIGNGIGNILKGLFPFEQLGPFMSGLVTVIIILCCCCCCCCILSLIISGIGKFGKKSSRKTKVVSNGNNLNYNNSK